MQSFKNAGYQHVRIYDISCNSWGNVVPAANAAGLNVLVTLPHVASAGSDLTTAAQQLGNDLSKISWLSVGNEPVNSGSASAAQVASAVSEVKSQLPGLKFNGQVGAVEVFNQIHPDTYGAVIEAVDVVMANAHAYFNPGQDPKEAGSWVSEQISTLQGVSNGKEVCITESGWACGGSGGVNPATPQAQQSAMESLSGMNIFHFSALSTAWKNTGTDEDHFGFWPGQC